MSERNPFALPVGMSWLEYMRTEPPGTMIWQVLTDMSSSSMERHIAIILREESRIIESLPKGLGGGVLLLWRFGLIPVTLPSGRRVGFVPILLRTPGGIAESNLNVLHLDEKDYDLLERPMILVMIGDRGKVERNILFPEMGVNGLSPSARGAIEMLRESPWTDAEYNQAKAIVEAKFDLSELWRALGGERG